MTLRSVTHVVLRAFCLAMLCASTAATALAQADKVTIGDSKLIISLPVFVAADQGLFAQNGLDVTLEEFETAQPLMDALVSGKVDVAGYTAYAITMNASLRAKKELYYLTSLVEDAQHPISKLLVKKDSPIQSIADLKGKRVGILPTIAYTLWLEAILAKNGVDPAAVTLQNVAPPLSGSALESGAVDALFTNDPAAAVLTSGVGKELVPGAVVELASREGTRRMPLAELLVGPGRMALGAGEIVLAVCLPPPPPDCLQHFEKVGRRDALAIAVASLAALIVRDAAGRVTEARIAVGSPAPTVLRCRGGEAFPLGRRLDRETLHALGQGIREGIAPIDDIRATAAYRRQTAGNLPLRRGRRKGPSPCRPGWPEPGPGRFGAVGSPAFMRAPRPWAGPWQRRPWPVAGPG
ncbi:MAG: ABC transporter substrate-binding protein [Solidesulfovibrio sp. DCME]|uniref:ABC transporter substrate-binding protein n=1 Tax=Solidesulfovibrio sp. DCME TaxID=3447380 RepID=UPI003D09D647